MTNFVESAIDGNTVDAAKAFDERMQENLQLYIEDATAGVAEELFTVDESNLDEGKIGTTNRKGYKRISKQEYEDLGGMANSKLHRNQPKNKGWEHYKRVDKGDVDESQLDEISKGLAGRYINKASGDMHRIGQDVHQQRRDLRDLHDVEFGGYGVPYKDRIAARDGRKNVESDVRKSNRRGSNHAAGIGRAVKRLQKEEVIDELSKGTMHRYVNRSASDIDDRARRSQRLADLTYKAVDSLAGGDSNVSQLTVDKLAHFHDSNERNITHRRRGIRRVMNKLTKEDVDESQLDELSKGTLTRYRHASERDAAYSRKQARGIADSKRVLSRDDALKSSALFDRAEKRERNIDRADAKIDRNESYIDEVQRPNARPDREMAALNPIERYQLFDAPNNMFDPDMEQAPKRKADAARLPDADQAKVDKMERDVKDVRPTGKLISHMSSNWKAGLKGTKGDQLSDGEARNYPIFSGGE